MLKELIKNELFQLNQYYVYNRKTNSLRSKKSIAGVIVLVVFLFISLAAAFFGMDQLFAGAFISTELEWVFFSMTGMIAILLGIFGDIFNTYNMLYKSKDNDLLLSMPIEPSKILFAKMVGVSVMGFVYSSIVFIPAMITYWIAKPFSLSVFVLPLIIWLLIAVFVVVITCVIGWVIACISSKIKSKNFVKVLATLAFLAVYYLVYFKALNSLENVIMYREKIADVISGWLFLFYHMGLGAVGKGSSMLIFAGIVLALFAALYFVMTKTYINMVTTNKGEKKVAYKKTKSKKQPLMRALIGKELKRFTSSSTYMLNSGLGLVICIVLAVVLLIKLPAIRGFAATLTDLSNDIPWLMDAITVAAALVPMFILSMNIISAPSVSLEGKSIWVLQSSPVDCKKVFQAKILTHIILCTFSTVVLPVAVVIAFKLRKIDGILVIVFSLVDMLFVDITGVLLDFIKGNLNWTNEVYPIKQGFSATVLILGGWGMILLLGGIYVLLRNAISGTLYVALMVLFLFCLSLWFYRILMKKAEREFNYLK